MTNASKDTAVLPGASASEPSKYPQRSSHFAHRYTRLLTKTCAAQEIGHVAFVLCVTIAHQEDAKRYKGPVTFFNEQLMPPIGVAKWEALDHARARAVKAGWLHYEPGNRGLREPGRYWVEIPSAIDDLSDAPCDETQYPAKGESVESQSRTHSLIQYPAKGDRDGDRPGDRDGEHSTLSLSLNKRAARAAASRPPRRFVKPSFDQVTAYVAEIGSAIDPAAFIDFYESKGWKVGKTPMKDWKAAVRTWTKRDSSSVGGNNGQAHKSNSSQPLPAYAN